MTDKRVEEMTWDDLDRIMRSGCEDQGFIERARRAILKRIGVDKPVEQMTKSDLDRIERSGCKDQEFLQKISKEFHPSPKVNNKN